MRIDILTESIDAAAVRSPWRGRRLALSGAVVVARPMPHVRRALRRVQAEALHAQVETLPTTRTVWRCIGGRRQERDREKEKHGICESKVLLAATVIANFSYQ